MSMNITGMGSEALPCVMNGRTISRHFTLGQYKTDTTKMLTEVSAPLIELIPIKGIVLRIAASYLT